MRFERETREISGGRKLYLYRFGDGEKESAKQIKFWSEVAEEWNSQHDFIENWFLSATKLLHAGLGSRGGLLLDLACGAMSMPVGPGWQRVGMDIVHEMICRQGSAVRGSLCALPFLSQSFDGVSSRFGLMFAEDVEEAMCEAARVLKPGGAFAMAVWAEPERNLWATVASDYLCDLLALQPPRPTDPSAYRLSDKREVAELLTIAGIEDVSCAEVPLRAMADISPTDAYHRLAALAGPTATMLKKLTPEQRQSAEREIVARLARADRTGHAIVWSGVRK